ncbi:MAG: hypothetical protein KDA52_14880 [Planctomycetaceae bacterium]|nr:hypothetical protein [Planctomycetaceae bacterium]
MVEMLEERGHVPWEAEAYRNQPEVSHLDFEATPAIIDAQAGSQLSEIWRNFPQKVAVRVTSPLWAGFVRIDPTQVSPFENERLHFREAWDPVWDWLIRQVDADVDIRFVDTIPINPRSNGLGSQHLVPWRPGSERDWLLENLLHGELIVAPESPVDEVALRAGLLQLHDFLHESHQHAQSIEGEGRHRNGDYWHAIMHRREPDYGNSKYWYRRVGHHPIFPQLAELAQSALTTLMVAADTTEWQQRLGTSSRWDEMAFVDICEECAEFTEDNPLRSIAGIIQSLEMQLLLEHTCRNALGQGTN